MAYYTGTQAASATIASDFMTTFDTYIISGGFTFVETYTSGTDVTNVYKSPAGSNSLSMDWYLFVNRISTSATYVSFGVAEAYNSSTHLATKYAPYGVPTTANTSDYTVSDAGVLPSATTSGACLFKLVSTGTGTINTTTIYTWYLNVTPDRVIFGKSTAAGGSPYSMSYAGICDPLVDNWNVVIGTLTVVNNSNTGSPSSTIYGAVTRDYGIPATVSTAYQAAYVWHIQVMQNTSTGHPSFLSLYAGTNSYQYVDSAYGGGYYRGNRIVAFGSRQANTYAGVCILKDIICVNGAALATTIAGGDTLSLTNSTGTYNYVRTDSYGIAGLATIAWLPKQ
jgi:hypothetical protein